MDLPESEIFRNQSRPLQRAGSKFRSGERRISYVKDVGWFVAIRGETEVHEGIEKRHLVGPFADKRAAKKYLFGVIAQERPDLIAEIRARRKSRSD